MSLGLRDYRRRRRAQVRWTIFKAVLVAAVLGAGGLNAYRIGSSQAQGRVESLEAQVADLRTRAEELQAQVQMQAAIVAREKARADELDQRYRHEVPQGPDRALYAQLRAKLDAGVTAERLKLVLEQISPQRLCQRFPSRRVAVQTEIATARPADFDGEAVSMTLAGTSARNKAGAPEAWFDKEKPIRVTLAASSGTSPSVVEGVVPLRPALVAGDREYRFEITAAARGFVQVSLERCRFP